MMQCPVCGHEATPGHRFCALCGTVIPTRKPRWWPPVLALVLMFAAGLSAFLLIRFDSRFTTDAAMPWFAVKDGVLYFDSSLYDGSNELTVPATIGGQPVTAISDYCFRDCDSLTAIHLPEGITSIGAYAFYDCDGLRGIRLPETLTWLGDQAFAGCNALEAVCIPYSLKQAGSLVFAGCTNLNCIFYPAPIAQWKAIGITGFRSGVTVCCADGVYVVD